MDTANQICPICEEVNARSHVVCKCCGQDMRVSPLNDYLAFVGNSPDSRRNELCFQFGTLKHKIKISYDAIKHLLLKDNYDKTNTVLKYYRSMIDRELSSLNYYLLLFSKRIFLSYYNLLLLDCNVYFTMVNNLLARTSMISYTENPEAFAEGIRLVTEQKTKLNDLIDEVLEQMEAAEEDDNEEEIWEFPPPPPSGDSIIGMLENSSEN